MATTTNIPPVDETINPSTYKEPAPLVDKHNPLESMMHRFDKAAEVLKLEQMTCFQPILLCVSRLALIEKLARRTRNSRFRDLIAARAAARCEAQNEHCKNIITEMRQWLFRLVSLENRLVAAMNGY